MIKTPRSNVVVKTKLYAGFMPRRKHQDVTVMSSPVSVVFGVEAPKQRAAHVPYTFQRPSYLQYIEYS